MEEQRSQDNIARKISFERYKEQLNRGYDIIQNKGFGPGNERTQPYFPVPAPRQKVWDFISGSNDKSTFTLT